MADLDDDYANAAYIDGAEAYPPRWADSAQAFRDSLGDRAQLGLSYGSGEREAFDLFVPEGAAKGTLIFVHGGYWRAFDRSSWSHFAAGPLARGWAVAMPSYDLCPAVHIRDITRQTARAVARIAEMTEGPITLAGHSAGGHLVARMLDPDLISTQIAARVQLVMPISPLSDLRPLLQTSMNDVFGLDLAEAEAESPVLMSSRHTTPVTVWVGGDERPAFLAQARDLSTVWDCELVVAKGLHHFNVLDPMCDPESDLVRRLTA